MTQAFVTHSFVPKYEDELYVKLNDIVQIVEKDVGVDGWFEVSNGMNKGKVPASHLKIIDYPLFGPQVRAIHTFNHPDNSGQFLSFNKGDQLELLHLANNGWNVGIIKQHIGLFPEGYIELPQPHALSDLEQASVFIPRITTSRVITKKCV
jgi:hypothetical protein